MTTKAGEYKLKAQSGKCVSCGKKPRKGRRMCEPCAIRHAGYVRELLRSRRKDGLCECGKPREKGSSCAKCYDRKQNASRNMILEIKQEAFDAYGGCVCACCGETEIWVLVIDHINGGGSAQRRKLGVNGAGYHFYKWLKAHKWPPGYRVLCSNCNLYIHINGKCYHSSR